MLCTIDAVESDYRQRGVRWSQYATSDASNFGLEGSVGGGVELVSISDLDINSGDISKEKSHCSSHHCEQNDGTGCNSFSQGRASFLSM